jgi:cellobiose phosphorylase
MLSENAELSWANEKLEILDSHIDKYAWDGEWYLRAYRYDGLTFGSNKNEEGKIFLNPQTWAVYSGHASGEKARKAMDSVKKELATEYGIMICSPPYEKTDFTVIRATLMNKGMKENAGIFNHIQGWAVIAEAMMGNGNQAWEYFRAYLPSAYNNNAEVREVEPYVYSQSTHSKYSPRYGASRLPWLSGTATWAYFTACQYILGVKPTYDGLEIDPCIPSHWKEFSVTRLFRGKLLEIKYSNPSGLQKGVKKLRLNGIELKSNFILFEDLREKNEVIVEM